MSTSDRDTWVEIIEKDDNIEYDIEYDIKSYTHRHMLTVDVANDDGYYDYEWVMVKWFTSIATVDYEE